MFDQLVKRSDAVWIYSTGRFAEERRILLCHSNERGHGLHTLRQFNKFLLVIAEGVRRFEPNGVVAKAVKARLQQLLPSRVDGERRPPSKDYSLRPPISGFSTISLA
jgi:hypothetical protein